MVRTRIAPSPTGFPHIGTIYQAIFDYVLAHKYGGQFVVRIEDTDRARLVEGAEDAVLDALEWFGLYPDESPKNPGDVGPYRQSERLNKYKEYIDTLVNKKLPQDLLPKNVDPTNQSQYCAYYCFCTKERLDALREQQQKEKKTPRYDKHCLNVSREEAQNRIENESYVVRLNIPSNKPIEFDDWLVGRVEVTSNDVDDQVLMKADGFPTYHFAVVVDDHLMEITHVIRGREWLPSTPKHIILYKYFDWIRPVYIHLPVILNMDGKGKLSKRHGHASVNYYKEEGFLPKAIVNYLINIVWNNPDGKEIFDIEEFQEKLYIHQIEGAHRFYPNTDSGISETINPEERFITSQGPRFDLDKLKWVNQQYIQDESKISNDELKRLIIEFSPKARELSDEILNALLPLLRTRMQTLKDFETLTRVFFADKKSIETEEEKAIAQDLAHAFTSLSDWNHAMIFGEMKKIMEEKKIRMPVLYKIITGEERGLPLPQVLEILGKEQTLKLLDS